MGEFAISVKNISKQYVLGGEYDTQKTFREMLNGLVGEPLRRLRKLQGKYRRQETFWALKDISFEVQPGEVLGIIGRNGAGKSTLLKILSRITAPTSGEIQYRGRLASLLEVGTGFHPELSGRENIFINGAILGMAKAEIRRKFDEIVDFAGIEQFLDTPVKRYSSGMYVRLAFAVAAHLDPDILVVDEVLAVGDAEFQKKCLGKMKEVSGAGRTVLFVSHNMSSITRLCSHAIWLNEGELIHAGITSDTISEYLSSLVDKHDFQDFSGELVSSVEFVDIKVNNCSIRDIIHIDPREEILLSTEFTVKKKVSSAKIIFSIRKNGEKIIDFSDVRIPADLKSGNGVSKIVIPPLFLSPGVYTVSLGLFSDDTRLWMWAHDVVNFSVQDVWSYDYDSQNMGIVNLPGRGMRYHQ